MHPSPVQESTAGSPTPPLLAVRGVSKRFDHLQALAGVDLDFVGGEIHAVLGENGAGKSTLMHILSGVHRPDAGTLLIDGQPALFASPRAARAAGIGMVHQHFTLIDTLSVAENLALSLPQPSRWRFRPAAAAATAAELAARVGLDLSPAAARVADLSVGARQRLEILKALSAATRVLILDEPTAVLTPSEVRQLFALLRQLRGQGRAVIFITHKLREVREIADRVTIMRRGRVITTGAAQGLSERDMAERMVGTIVMRPRPTGGGAAARLALEVAGLCMASRGGGTGLRDVSFAVRAGELFGIAGVDGNGQRELFDALVGLQPPTAGAIRVAGAPLMLHTPAAALAAGIGHIPPDRQREGLILPMSVEENLLLSRAVLQRFRRRGLLQWRAAVAFAAELARQYGIRADALAAPAAALSGGNQQRVVVARELAQNPRVLITVNPTRGLDVAATAAVADALAATAHRGCAVVVISTDLDEVLDLCERISVLSRGHLSAPLEPPIDAERLGLLMGGAL